MPKTELFGNEKLKRKITLLPDKPGIYFFKNKRGEFIYIGKARSLRERVKAYFTPSRDPKVTNIIAETVDLDFILTGSEKEAAFLENNFVQRHQPKFNLRLKDDKAFPYLKLPVSEKYPGVYLTRKVVADGATYFGPFSPASQVRKSIHLLNKYFGIRGCEEAVPGRRKRPCLEYELKLCSAPCVGFIGEKGYRENLKNALLFLEGKTEELLQAIEVKMKEAAERQDYEQAAHWRDLIRAVTQIRDKPGMISVGLENIDIFGFVREKNRASLYIFFMRKGKVAAAEEASIEAETEAPDAEVLKRFLEVFYGRAEDLPDKILLPFPFPGYREWGKRVFGGKKRRIRLSFARQDTDQKLVEMANKNASLLLRKDQRWPDPVDELANVLKLAEPPARIEGFDISTTGGEESTGSVVVFKEGRPKKDEYRKFKIKSVSGPDDIASLQEIIERRYRRVLEEKGMLPDLIMVDGGKGQLRAAQAVLQKLGLGKIPLISLAKREEMIFIKDRKEGFRLERTSSALRLLQHLRDESHRFAISFHRQRRKKRSFESRLDGIRGLGEKRKRSLLARFQNLEEIRQASLEELALLVGMNVARKIKEESDDHGHRR